MIRAGRNIITHDILAHLDHARTQPPPAQISHPIAARVSAVSAALRVSWCNDAKALLRFGFDQPAAGLCHIACARLAGPDAAESWLIDDPIIATQTDTLQRWCGGGMAALHVRVDERAIGIGPATELEIGRAHV